MAGLALGALRDALADQLVANIGAEINVSRRGEATTPPSITLSLAPNDSIEYETTMDGTTVPSVVRFWLRIEPATGGDWASAVGVLDDLLSHGPTNTASVVDALMEDTTLGGLVMDMQFLPVATYIANPDPLAPTLLADLPVMIVVGV